MSVRHDATGDYLSRTTNLPGTTTFTIMGWIRLKSDRNTYSGLFNLGNATSQLYYSAYIEVDGVSLAVFNGAETGTGSALSVGTWYHVTLSVSAGAATVFLNGVSNVGPLVGRTNAMEALRIGQPVDDTNQWADCEFANVKIWDGVALTAAQIVLEMWSPVPVRQADLNSWFPLWNAASAAQDMSGKGRHLTVAGSMGTGDNPRVMAWAREPYFPYAAAAAAVGQPARKRMGGVRYAGLSGPDRGIW